MSGAKTIYRPDIDGLRAVAVLPVVAFHAGFERFAPGGYVGVDIFFVISGYLITRIIYNDIQAGTYSVAAFYQRRARRILPALTVVFLFCALVGLLEYFPVETPALSSGMLASSLFVSNILFYYTSGYFDQAIANNPLLHTWSLSVEEQFYILFPILVWALRGLSPRRRLATLAGLALLSLVAAAVAVPLNASAAFYLVQFRAWELLVGALISLGAVPRITAAWAAEAVGALGLLLIAASIYLLNRSSPFPGLAALGPCVGAGLLIHAGTERRTAVARLLGSPPIRFVGLISYSLYLWHWPVIVFGSMFHEPRSGVDRLMIVLVSLVAAVLSWRFVERPFRHPVSERGVRRTLAASGGVIVATCAAALLLSPVSRTLWVVPEQAASYLTALGYDPNPDIRSGTCFLTSANTSASDLDAGTCLHLSDTKDNVLIVGDSHAAHLWAGFADRFPDVNFLQATASGCKPVEPLYGASRCVDLVRHILSDFIPQHRFKAIVLSGRWTLNEVPRAIATAASLRSHADRVAISGPITEYSEALPRVLASAVMHGTDLGAFSAGYLRSEPKEVDAAFRAQQLPPGVVYLSVYGALCQPGCDVLDDARRPLQFDYGHLTRSGSGRLAAAIGPEVLGRRAE